MVRVVIKVPKRRVFWETERVERGKPRERETQILVGELLLSETKLSKGPSGQINVYRLLGGTEHGL